MSEPKIRLAQVTALETRLDTIYTQANSAYGAANTASSTGGGGYDQANNAYAQANTARDTANDAYGQANTGRTTANNAYASANLAYAAANNSNLKLGGLVSGTLNVTQDLIVGGNIYLEGNTTYINVATYSVEDSLIYMSSNNKLTDSVDIGFMGGKNTGGSYAHTGLARDATDGKWKLFDGLAEEGHVGNVVDFANTYLATLVANVEANTLTVVNGISGNVNFDSGTLFIDSAGNKVGIGTVSPNSNTKLDILGALGFQRVGSDLTSGNDASGLIYVRQNGNPEGLQEEMRYLARNHRFYDHTGSTLLSISSLGRVGIQVTNPSSRLDIQCPAASLSDFGLATGSTINLRIPNVTNYLGQIVFTNDLAPNYGYGSIGMVMMSGSGIGYGDMVFGTKSVGADAISTERMRITYDGKTGIGTSAPTSLLTLKSQGATPFLTVHRIGSATEQLAFVSAEDTGNYTTNRGYDYGSWTHTIDGRNSNLVLSTHLAGGTGGTIHLDANVVSLKEGRIAIERDGSSGSPGSWPTTAPINILSWAGDGPSSDTSIPLLALNAARVNTTDTYAGNAYLIRGAADDGVCFWFKVSGAGYVRGNFQVGGALSKGSGSFKIDHPLPEKSNTHHLVHSFIEGPQADLIYSGKVQLENGFATINIDTHSNMTEGTFIALCRDIRCFTTNESSWDAVRGLVSGNILTIECQNSSSNATVSWIVIGERRDKHMYETDWTDENGKVIVEPEKKIIELDEEDT